MGKTFIVETPYDWKLDRSIVVEEWADQVGGGVEDPMC